MMRTRRAQNFLWGSENNRKSEEETTQFMSDLGTRETSTIGFDILGWVSASYLSSVIVLYVSFLRSQ